MERLEEFFWSRQRLLVISPHADDETFGCAGTMAKVKSYGGKVYVILVSVGTVVQFTPAGVKKISGGVREKEFTDVMRFLKVDDIDILYKDAETHMRLDAMPRRELVERFETGSKLSLQKLNPTMIALPAISYNQDHEAVFKAGFTACRPHIRDIKSFQRIVVGYDNPAISWSLEREKFHPNFYVDISRHLETKLQAVSMYKTQEKPSTHHASIESIEYLSKVRGREISVDAAEAFVSYRFAI
jgi:N-acetylglucosamine malate deacetylase 1